MPDLFLPFLPGSLSPTSLLVLMSCQGPGLPGTEGVQGGVKALKWDGGGCFSGQLMLSGIRIWKQQFPSIKL